MKRILNNIVYIVLGLLLGTLATQARAFYFSGNITKVIVVDENGNEQEFFPLVTSSPDATATFPPTAPPTNTPRPTATSTPQPTSTAEVIPTAEVTPTLQPTEIPYDDTCYAGVVSAGLNVRTEPWYPATKLGVLKQADRVEVTFIQITRAEGDTEDREEWGQITYGGQVGWIALWYGGKELAVLDDNEFCWEIPKEYEENPLPTVFYSGFHTLAGEGAGILLAPQYVNKYNIIKCLDGGWKLCLDAKAANPNIKIVFRTFLHDWARVEYFDKPEEWWAIIEGSLPPGADWYEIQNEHDPSLEYAEEWAYFSIEMAKIIEREREASLLAFSSGPGNPDFGWWKDMWIYINWAVERNKLVGTNHGVATHSSVFAPASISLPSDSWINNPFIAGREQIVCELAEANNYGALCGSFVWINSEIGWGDGYQGNQDDFSCYEQGLMYRETISQKKVIGVSGFTLWNIGKLGNWLSVHDCVPYILE